MPNTFEKQAKKADGGMDTFYACNLALPPEKGYNDNHVLHVTLETRPRRTFRLE